MRRALETTAEMALLDMNWEEHWADVEFRTPFFGVEELRARLLPAGAWCDVWSSE